MSDILIPKHIGYVIDGNRRWAKMHGLPAYEGHLAGYNAIKEVLLETLHSGVKYATAYIFSTENWKRSKDEVGYLMGMLLRVLESDLPTFLEHNVQLKVIGTRDGLSDAVLKAIDKAEDKTASLNGGTLLLCLNYGGQLEIVDAVKKIVQSGLQAEEITADVISKNLYASEVPPCDLIVRTSGEKRLSNFMLWRAAYSEFIFLEKNWPDMTKEDVSVILDEYASRHRRFGG